MGRRQIVSAFDRVAIWHAATRYRTAMPMPMPEGMTFHHLKNAPAVQARHNGQAVGTLKWNGDEEHPDHGEVIRVDVHPDYQHHGLATKLFDLAGRIEPTLHHSVTQTPAGAAWAKYEENRKGKRYEAAVNQDLVNGLHNEFKQWWKESYPERKKNNDPALMDYQKYGDPDVGPIGNWPSIESFMKARYPAAHQGLGQGYEGARTLLDWDKMYPDEEPGGHQRYETGPEAVAQHGYDPKEVAAGMLLLHNRSQPLREDLAQEDQKRLNDIFDKRQKMQRDYEQRQKVAMWR